MTSDFLHPFFSRIYVNEMLNQHPRISAPNFTDEPMSPIAVETVHHDLCLYVYGAGSLAF